MHDNVYDPVITELVGYAYGESAFDKEALHIARLCLLDSMGCVVAALDDPTCSALLNSAAFSKMANGVPVMGQFQTLGPIEAAFHIGTLVRWLEYNDTWLAQEWGHPSDNLGAILSAAAWRSISSPDTAPIRMGQVVNVMIRAYEIHGILCLTNCFNELGIDHVVLVKLASTIAASRLLGLSEAQAKIAASNAIIDGHPLRTYRHAPNAGTRKSWASGDATARGVQLALFAQAGEMGYPTAVTTPKWGFNDSVLRGTEFNIARPLSDYVVKNILFKVPNPAEYHAQTAVEAALRLRTRLADRGLGIESIAHIRVETQAPAMRIIDKAGPLNNPADRDHCMQYMVAVALLNGDLTSADFREPQASNSQIESLRSKIYCVERSDFTARYYDPDLRAIPNALYIDFAGSETELSEVIEFPLGHVRRREECIPVLKKKFIDNVSSRFSPEDAGRISNMIADRDDFLEMSALGFLNELHVTKI